MIKAKKTVKKKTVSKKTTKKRSTKKPTMKKTVKPVSVSGFGERSGVRYMETKIEKKTKKTAKKSTKRPVKKLYENIEKIEETKEFPKKAFSKVTKEEILQTCFLTLQRAANSCKPTPKSYIILIFVLGILFGIFSTYVFQNKDVFSKPRDEINTFLGYSVESFEDHSIRKEPTTPKDFKDVDLEEFWEVWRILEKEFVSKPVFNGDEEPYYPDREDFIRGAIEGLTWATKDRYTNYIRKEKSDKFADEIIRGSISGIGAYIGIENGFLTIIRPIENSPAKIAGLKKGDIIVTINGESTSYLNLSESVDKIRGERGSKVSLGIIRPITEEELTIVVTRDEIDIPTVEFVEEDGVFVIKILTFTQKTPKAFTEAIIEYLNKDANTEEKMPILIDLRGNAGGIISSAVFIAGFFIPEDETVLYEYRGNKVLRRYKSTRRVFTKETQPPITILVDKSSASASEILAAALSYHKVGNIIGTGTFGKGSVQTLKNVGNNAILKITIAQWLTPGKKSISDIGITPDIDYEKYIKEQNREDINFDADKFLYKEALKEAKK